MENILIFQIKISGMVSTLGKCNSLIIIDENLESIKKIILLKFYQ